MSKQNLAKLHLVKNPREYAYLTKVTGEGEEGEEGGGGGGRGRVRGGGERREGREGRRRGTINREGSITRTHTHTHT